jgi:putative SOS response-associated peptidase YedK
MCGRYLLDVPGGTVAAFFDADPAGVESSPTFNAAPSQPLPVVLGPRAGRERRTLELLQWGFVPAWAAGKQPPFRPLINARSETAWEKPSFRTAMQRSRCIVPASGFYEWQPVEGQKAKQPMCFADTEASLLAFAAIHERSKAPDGSWRDTFAILTTSANDVVRPAHDRMPVFLDTAGVGAWLDPTLGRHDLAGLLAPWPSERTRSWAVSTLVNDTSNDRPEVAQPIVA